MTPLSDTLPGRKRRVMITGSRDWSELSVIRMALAAFYPGRTGDWQAPTIVHGDARGADRMAADIAQRMGFGVEAHPADWEKHGKRAGPIRNREMLDSGIDHVVAFHFNDSRGTRDAVDQAKRRGIPVTRYAVRDGYPKMVVETWTPQERLIA